LIQSGVVTASTLVWKSGMADWQGAGAVGLVTEGAPDTGQPPTLPFAPSEATSGPTAMAVLTHILGLFTGVLGPLVVLAATQSAAVKRHARQALNWQISFLIYLVLAGLLCLIVIGMPLLFLLIVLNPIFCVVAAAKAADGQDWKYPLAIPFLGG